MARRTKEIQVFSAVGTHKTRPAPRCGDMSLMSQSRSLIIVSLEILLSPIMWPILVPHCTLYLIVWPLQSLRVLRRHHLGCRSAINWNAPHQQCTDSKPFAFNDNESKQSNAPVHFGNEFGIDERKRRVPIPTFLMYRDSVDWGHSTRSTTFSRRSTRRILLLRHGYGP